MKYENLFTHPSTHSVVSTLKDFFALSETDRVFVTISDRALGDFPIAECNEPLLPLATYLPEHSSSILLVAGEAALGAQSLDTQRLRTSAAERLLQAEQFIQSVNQNLTFKITDSYRPLSLQKKYFDEVYARYQAAGLTGDELYNRTIQGIADPACHPPHCTGGTVDLTIIEKDTGQELNMGSKLDDVDDANSATFSTTVSEQARQNRVLLYTAMIEAGFVNSPSEWWHYTYGTPEWAARTGNASAIYDSV